MQARGAVWTARATQLETPVKPVPPAPEGLAAAGGVKSVRLEWDPLDDPDVKGYAVYRQKKDDSGFDRIARVTDTSEFVDKGSGFNPLVASSADFPQLSLNRRR